MAGVGFGTITYSNGNTRDNYKTEAGNGLGPVTRILSLTTDAISQAELDAVVGDLTAGGTSGTNDAVTVAGISGAVGDAVVYVAVQGTGVLTAASDWNGNTGIALAVVATFTD